MLFLALKKFQIIKINLPQVLNVQLKKSLPAKFFVFSCPQWGWGGVGAIHLPTPYHYLENPDMYAYFLEVTS